MPEKLSARSLEQSNLMVEMQVVYIFYITLGIQLPSEKVNLLKTPQTTFLEGMDGSRVRHGEHHPGSLLWVETVEKDHFPRQEFGRRLTELRGAALDVPLLLEISFQIGLTNILNTKNMFSR